MDNDVIEKAGSWFAYENEKIGQGRENVRQYLNKNVSILDKIEKQILAKIEEKDKA